MERLTSKKFRNLGDCFYNFKSKEERKQICKNQPTYEELYRRLAELEDKIESGQLIELPCKIGDRAYAILEVNNDYEIFEYTLKEIIISEYEFYFETPTGYSHKLKFGKRVFADRTQAEARLKVLQEKNNE